MKLIIENSSYCNQECYFCPRKKYRNKDKIMEFEKFKKIIDSIITLIPIETITFGGMGEPLTDPRLMEKIEYAKKFAKIRVYTNGKLLTEEKMNHLGNCKVKVYFSFHGNTPEEYEKISGNKFEIMKAKIDMAKKILKNNLIVLNYPRGKLSDILKVKCIIHPIHNWDDEEIKQKTNSQMSGCRFCDIMGWIIIRVDGSFGTCGNDWDNENNILEQKFDKCMRCCNKNKFLIWMKNCLNDRINLLKKLREEILK